MCSARDEASVSKELLQFMRRATMRSGEFHTSVPNSRYLTQSPGQVTPALLPDRIELQPDWYPGVRHATNIQAGYFVAAKNDLVVHARLRISGTTGIDVLLPVTQSKDDMKAELKAIIEAAPEGGFWAVCAEVPGANGQGGTVEQAKQNLRDAVRW